MYQRLTSTRLSASAPLDRLDEDVNPSAAAPRRSTRTALSFELIPPRHDADTAQTAWSQLNAASGKPLVNRAIGGDGQPGAGQALVPVGAELLLDLLEDINH